MRFLSADYWQQTRDGNASALLLQQYLCEGVCVHFSCVCRGMDGCDRAGGYMTEQLLQWFRGLSLKRLVRRTGQALEEAQEDLRRVIFRVDGELAAAGTRGLGGTADESKSAVRGLEGAAGEAVPAGGLGGAGRDGAAALAGIFCVGEDFFYFCRGEQRIYFINTGFGCAHIRRLGEDGGVLFIQRGILQPDIGLLFAVGSFCGHVTEQMIREGLSVREVVTEEQMGKHLNELGKEAQRQGGKDMAAVFVRTVEGDGA